MKRHENKVLVHPTAKQRKALVRELRKQTTQLRYAQTLMQVACCLTSLQTTVREAADLHGISWEVLEKGTPKSVHDILLEQSDGDESFLTMLMPGGRARPNTIKKAILKYAEKHPEFTVDDLMKHVHLQVTRQSLAANLYLLSKSGSLRRVWDGEMGRKGSPPTYGKRSVPAFEIHNA